MKTKNTTVGALIARLPFEGGRTFAAGLLLAGAMADPADQALLVFNVADPSVIEAFARNDPYVINGLVARWEVRPWTVVIGNDL